MEADSTSITQRSNISASLWSNGASQVGCPIHSLTRKIENTSFMKERSDFLRGSPMNSKLACSGTTASLGVLRSDRHFGGLTNGAVARSQGRPDRLNRFDHGRNGNRERTDRPRHSQTVKAFGAPVYQCELRSGSFFADHVGVVWPRKRSLHWSSSEAARPIRIGRGRHDFSRRSRRSAYGDANRIAARFAGTRV